MIEIPFSSRKHDHAPQESSRPRWEKIKSAFGIVICILLKIPLEHFQQGGYHLESSYGWGQLRTRNLKQFGLKTILEMWQADNIFFLNGFNIENFGHDKDFSSLLRFGGKSIICIFCPLAIWIEVAHVSKIIWFLSTPFNSNGKIHWDKTTYTSL